ncbi:hypothetical protein ACFO4P_07630 [Epilithonimonas pallida]|uniref:Conserved repeat domain-containing protein n=1 Tax=Epilithonimonas pallida TaxID=373671 RepID=A0ABY1R4Z5_9FLAO|nr:hypothetical protein [Epilithonimonas pallida]SMP94182.1 conserved repeat domain-containing protein [Epilithonimonas pallida]
MKKNNLQFLQPFKLILIIMMVCSSNYLFADGSKDLYPNGVSGYRAYLRSATTDNGWLSSWPFPNEGTHYVYAVAGETITLASSAQNGGNGRIRMYAPNGTEVVNNTNNGQISNRNAELAGPLYPGEATGGNRYAAIQYSVTTTGIYRVQFIARGFSEPFNTTINANGTWTQDSSSNIYAWDVSVRDAANTVWIPGRVYTNTFCLSSSVQFPESNGFYGKIYVLTKDGYTYRIDGNGINGMFFQLFANNNGFVNSVTGVPLYKSMAAVNATTLAQIKNPNTADNMHITHKLFYTLPANDLPISATGAVPGGSTWVKNAVVSPNVSGVGVVGVEGTPGQVSNKGGNIQFTTAAAGRYSITLESTALPAAFVTRILTGNASIGANNVLWDGKDGNGNDLPAGNQPVKVSVKMQTGEVHFPFFDIEYNKNGIKIELLDHNNLNNVVSDLIYWDDTDVPNGTVGTNPRSSNPKNNSHLPPTNSAGISSNTNGHTFGAGVTGTGNMFGNDSGLDTWAFIESSPVVVNTNVEVKSADLKISEITPNKTSVAAGDNLTYTIKVKNDGPSNVSGAPFTFIIPIGFDPQSFTFAGNGCGSQAVALTYNVTTRTYSSTLNLPNGCEITYSITLIANAAITPGSKQVQATILRTNDITDPDATNPNPAVPPTDAQYECTNNGLGGSCNNILTNNIVTVSGGGGTTGACNPNTFLNSSDSNTLYYDNIVSSFHGTIARETDGTVKIWGEDTKPDGDTDQLVPTALTPANGYNYTGTILHFTAGSNGAISGAPMQYAILTTDGLWVWGRNGADPNGGNAGALLSDVLKGGTLNGSPTNRRFAKVTINGQANGMPSGIVPTDVKMMFGTYGALAIVTNNGDVYMLSFANNRNGNGAVSNTGTVWNRVKTGAGATDFLTNVVAVRGSTWGMIALTNDGKLYTWGQQTYLGNGTAQTQRLYATEMPNLPVTPKMIGMTAHDSGGSTYYLLGTNGRLYSLGNNNYRQLGDFTTTARTSWVQVHKPNAIVGGSTDSGTFMDDIVWISPNEHDNYNIASVSAISSSGKLYSWGRNSSMMIGGTANSTNYDPIYMPGGLNATDVIMAVEIGGHTSIAVKQCSQRYGYVGHRTNGSMGDGTSVDATENTYNFTNTGILNLCGAIGVPSAPTVQNLKICSGSTANLANAHTSALPSGYTLEWYTSSTMIPANKVADPTTVTAGTYYAFYVSSLANCGTPAASNPVTVSYYTAADPEYANCNNTAEICTKSVSGESFSWNYNGNAPSNPVTQTFTQPAANYGFILDIYSLDNSFNMDINGTLLAPQEMQFSTSAQSAPNIRFKADGAQWQIGSVPAIWMMNGTASSPVIRVQISPAGSVKMYGKRSDNAALEELELFDPVTTNVMSFNTIVWNTASSNTVIATQTVVGPTKLSGYGYGLNTVPCECIKPGMPGTPDGYTKVGVLTKAGITNKTGNISWPENVPNGHIVMDSAEKGFVITHMTTVQRDALIAIDGMLIYNTDLQCVQMYRGATTPVIEPLRTGWNCIKRGCNE